MKPATMTRYQQALAQMDGSPSLSSARRVALDRFLARGLPMTREEDWKYTALDYLEALELHIPQGTASAPATEVYPGTVLSFANGRLAGSDAPAAFAESLAARADTAPVMQYMGKIAGDSALAQINRALWQDGVLFHVPAHRKLTPLFVAQVASETDAMLHLRHLIVLEAGAEAVLVEHCTGASDTPYWNNVVTEIVLNEGARLTHLKLTEEGDAATHTGLTAVQQARDSAYRALSISTGGRLARHDFWVNLSGSGAECQLDGLFIADGRRHVDHHVHIEHHALHTTSRQTWRGMASGRGRGIFDSRVVVRPGAQETDALQSSRNLLLSPHAEIDVKPQLEIYADDVKCGHGATVGQLDEAQVFYLRSRGLDADAARTLLLRAFAEEALGLVKNSGLSGWLEPHLAAALPVLKKEITT